eukprot:NODE_783_length_4271_cov_0.386625.p2 type:complete len:344 gc:universal NODE_783_length_4271_cov_0.386625:2917-3948(+)
MTKHKGQKQKVKNTTKDSQEKPLAPFYSHLKISELLLSDKSVHPIIEKIGIKMAKYQIVGCNARCIAIVNGTLEWIQTAEKSQLMTSLNHQINYISSCRNLGIAVGNTVRFIKNVIDKHDKLYNKSEMIESLVNYKENRIYKAMDHISNQMASYISNADVILVFGKSSTVLNVLKVAKNNDFKVLIINSAPLNEGVYMKKSLDALSITNELVDISSISSVMEMATKVLLGAHAMLSNGNLVSRIGTCNVALIADQYKIPVIVCCETHKFSDKVLLNSLDWNELTSLDLIAMHVEKKPFMLVNALYDVVPAHLISMICCDIGCIPATSIPVAIREDRQMMLQYE